jgi:hypothetical protein
MSANDASDDLQDPGQLEVDSSVRMFYFRSLSIYLHR